MVEYRQDTVGAEARAVGRVLEQHGYFPAGRATGMVVNRVSSRAVVELFLFFGDAAFGEVQLAPHRDQRAPPTW